MEIKMLFWQLFHLEMPKKKLRPSNRGLARTISKKPLAPICRAIQWTNRWAKISPSEEGYAWKNFFLNSLIIRQGKKGEMVWGKEDPQNGQLSVFWDPRSQKLLLSCRLAEDHLLLRVHLSPKDLWRESISMLSRHIGQDLRLLVLAEKWGAELKTK